MKNFFKNTNWKIVAFWTLFMSFFNVFLVPYFDDKDFNTKTIITGIIVWFLSGIVMGNLIKQKTINNKP